MGSRLSAEPPAALPYRLLGLPRFVLALLVLLWHALPVGDLYDPRLYATDFGPVAVFVFFVLSGFIITEAALAFYRGRPCTFLANRLLRLWPAYLVALAAMALLLWLGVGTGDLSAANLAANALALFPTVVVTDPLLGLAKRSELLPVVWALRVEFAFYGIVALALLAGKFGGRILWVVPLCWLALAGSIACYHLALGSARATFYFGVAPYFVLGAAWALRGSGQLETRWLDSLLPPALVLAVLHSFSFNPFDADASGWAHATGWSSFAAAALFLLLVLWGLRRLRQGVAAAPAKIARDRLLGNLTYEIYLVHLPVVVFVGWLWPTPDWSSLLMVLALSLAAAALLAAGLGGALRPLRRRLRGAATPTLA